MYNKKILQLASVVKCLLSVATSEFITLNPIRLYILVFFCLFSIPDHFKNKNLNSKIKFKLIALFYILIVLLWKECTKWPQKWLYTFLLNGMIIQHFMVRHCSLFLKKLIFLNVHYILYNFNYLQNKFFFYLLSLSLFKKLFLLLNDMILFSVSYSEAEHYSVYFD